jgi:hypothetical protein
MKSTPKDSLQEEMDSLEAELEGTAGHARGMTTGDRARLGRIEGKVSDLRVQVGKQRTQK